VKTQVWVDATSYARGEAAKKTTPRAWSLGVGHLSQFKLHRHVSEPGRWFLTCYTLKLERHLLRALELEEAKTEALLIVAKQVKDIVNYYKELGVEV
jgi:hypothetical protein